MKIIEEFIEGKYKDQTKCEDIIFKGQRFIAIIDGATSKNGRLFEGKTGYRMAADLLLNTFHKLETKQYEKMIKPKYICEFLRLSFIPFYKKYNIDYVNEPKKKELLQVLLYMII